ncbi:hypothetical protein BvCmsHHP011_01479 [Escherichia coli]|nr:hypothetical protein BvCmsHHP011_01479 [Escherichia coli]GDU62318.1 hypothetical protein BvCmsSIP083_00004 [Escherichia coli]
MPFRLHYHFSEPPPGPVTAPGFSSGQSGQHCAAAPASVSPSGFSARPARSGISVLPVLYSSRPVPVVPSAASADGKNCLPLFPPLIFRPGIWVYSPHYCARLPSNYGCNAASPPDTYPPPDQGHPPHTPAGHALFLPLSAGTGQVDALCYSGRPAVYHPEWPVAVAAVHSPVPDAVAAVHYPAPAGG